MLQADAAILGFGAIFIIFKLQSLSSLREHAFNLSESWQDTYTNYARILATTSEEDKIVKTLKDISKHEKQFKREVNQDKYWYLILLLTIPERILHIKKMIKVPLIIIGTHASLSAISLWLTPQIINWCNSFFNPAVLLIIGSFTYGVYRSVMIAINLVSKTDELSLEKNCPKIFKLLK